MIRVTIIIVATLLSVFRLGFADYCSICVHGYCQTTYPTENDSDGDGMSDAYEMQLARQFKPVLHLEKRLDDLALKKYIFNRLKMI